MGFFKRRSSPAVSSSDGEAPPGKSEYNAQEYPAEDLLHPEIHGETRLQRGLKARHITMIGKVSTLYAISQQLIQV
jgi:hypothetical protein